MNQEKKNQLALCANIALMFQRPIYSSAENNLIVHIWIGLQKLKDRFWQLWWQCTNDSTANTFHRTALTCDELIAFQLTVFSWQLSVDRIKIEAIFDTYKKQYFIMIRNNFMVIKVLKLSKLITKNILTIHIHISINIIHMNSERVSLHGEFFDKVGVCFFY